MRVNWRLNKEMPRINEAADTDLKIIERLQQIGWKKARIKKAGGYLALSVGVCFKP